MGSTSARVLRAIQPGRDSIDADELDYPNLHKIIKEQRLGVRSWQIQGSPIRLPVDILNRDSGEDVAETYLLQIAYRLQKAHLPIEKKYWSKKYTRASISLYGKPKNSEVASLASLELDWLEDASSVLHSRKDFLAPVVNSYRSLATNYDPSALGLDQRYKFVLEKVRDYYLEKYEAVFSCFDEFAPNKMLEPYQVAECFYRALDVLEADDKEWANWSVLFNDDAKLSVNASDKQINIGKYRHPIHYKDIKGLFAHEVLVHALRALNGSKIDSDKLGIGLDGYVKFEEGLGALVESAVNGCVSQKIKDRYLDIALALGGKSRTPIRRHELFEISYARAVTRCITEGREADLNKLEDGTWEYVNRIYRGTLGNEYVGVFTRDISYYKGFCKAADYLLRVLAQGKSVSQGLEYLSLGKFDPTNRRHRDHIYSTVLRRI